MAAADAMLRAVYRLLAEGTTYRDPGPTTTTVATLSGSRAARSNSSNANDLPCDSRTGCVSVSLLIDRDVLSRYPPSGPSPNAQATRLYRRACAGASATTWMTRRPNFRSARCTRSNFSQREMPGGNVQMMRAS
jgi:hypothetical protein